MKNSFKKTIDFLIFSNLFIAICAMAQVALSYQFLHSPINGWILIFVGLCTLGMYNFSMVLSKPKSSVNTAHLKAIWSVQHYRLMLSITLITFAISGVIFLTKLNPISQLLMLIAGSISLLYNIPLITWNGKKRGLRNIPIIKVLLIAIVWSVSCTTLPMTASNFHTTNWDAFIFRSINSFLFITAITIPFDIRDIYQDTYYHLKTIPVLIGEKKSYLLCYSLLSINLLLLWICIPYETAIHIGSSANICITFLLIYYNRMSKNPIYYFILLDGTLLSQFLIVWVLHYFV